MDTRYLFHPIRFKSLSLPPRRCPFSTPPFSGESGCKNTTFFHSRKIFFQLFFMTHAILPVSQRFARENIFQSTLPERVSPTPEPPLPGAENDRFETRKLRLTPKSMQQNTIQPIIHKNTLPSGDSKRGKKKKHQTPIPRSDAEAAVPLWSIRESNPLPVDCEPTALPNELIPHCVIKKGPSRRPFVWWSISE